MFPLSASITTRNLVYFWARNFYNLVRGSPLNFAFFYGEVCRRRGPVDGCISLNLSAPSLSPLLWGLAAALCNRPRSGWFEIFEQKISKTFLSGQKSNFNFQNRGYFWKKKCSAKFLKLRS